MVSIPEHRHEHDGWQVGASVRRAWRAAQFTCGAATVAKSQENRMIERQQVRQGSVPKVIRSTRMLMFAQAVLGTLAGAFVLVLLGAAVAEDDSDGLGLMVVLTVLSIVMAVVLLVCAIVLPRRPSWVRVTVIAIESITVLGGAVNVLLGLSSGTVQPLAVLPVVLGLLVIKPLLQQDVVAWFDGEPTLLP
jgi:hypothetical protein